MRPWTAPMALALAAACGDGAEPTCTPASGVACTWLGLPGEEGFNGDGRHRLETQIYWSFDMLFASDGTPWFIDWNNHMVRRVKRDGTVDTVLGWTDPAGFPGDGGPGESAPGGAVGTTVRLNHPTDLAEAPDGSILVMAWHNHKLRRIDPVTGRVTIVCGAGAGYAGDGGSHTDALFRQPKALEVDSAGNIYILDQQNFRIRHIAPDGGIRTIAGNGTPGFSGDGGPALLAQLNFEAGSNPEPSGGLALDDGLLFFSDTLSDRIRVIDLLRGTVATFAGTGEPGFSGDGRHRLETQVNKPRDLEIGPDGDLYFADTDNNRIRAIDRVTGTVRTVAGTGELGLDRVDGLPATETKLSRPFAIEFDRRGNLYISDTINSRVLRVAP